MNISLKEYNRDGYDIYLKENNNFFTIEGKGTIPYLKNLGIITNIIDDIIGVTPSGGPLITVGKIFNNMVVSKISSTKNNQIKIEMNSLE